jgi:hypothetical protein
LAYADQTTSADALVFNGDDPVGLFKDGILIDVFGNFGGSNSFSNVTYRRKSIVTQPTTTFNLNDEWLMYAFDTFDGLGSHSQTLGDNDFVSERISFYPNPVSGHTIHFNNRSALTVTIYDVLGKKVLIARFDRPYHGLDISSLKKGIYILKINSPTGTVTKKLIRQ